APYTKSSVTLTGLTPNTLYHLNPSSICKSDCGNTQVGLRRNTDKTGKADWTFTTNATSITENPNGKGQKSPTAIAEARAAEITASEVTIRWKTNNPATSFVEYGLTSAYGSKSEENTIYELNHTIQLFDLRLGTVFHARAVSKDASTGAIAYSPDFTFTTPTAENRIVNLSTVFNEPNPCFERTTFVYYLYQPTKRVTIDIFTLSGKTVASLEAPQSTMMQGHNTVLWDLRDNGQKRLPAGLYTYKVTFYTADNHVDVKNSNLMIRN
ncbi:MAG: hypothetical protein JXB42_00030, partial [Deltaproteobacteria bacterium]|nr:hypothetical protein [Deltaproteobacteria bacterium]